MGMGLAFHGPNCTRYTKHFLGHCLGLGLGSVVRLGLDNCLGPVLNLIPFHNTTYNKQIIHFNASY